MEEILANIWQTIAMVFSPFTNIFSNVVWVLNSIWTLLSKFFNWSVWIIRFIVEAVKFIGFALKTIFNYVVKAFESIFVDWFFDVVANGVVQLSLYIWSFWTTTLVSLVVVAFLLIVYGFVMRLIKWSINYNSALKTLEKQLKTKI